MRVPEWIFAAGGVADEGVMRAEDGRDADRDVGSSAAWSVLRPVEEQSTGDEGFVPPPDEGEVSYCLGKLTERRLVGLQLGGGPAAVRNCTRLAKPKSISSDMAAARG